MLLHMGQDNLETRNSSILHTWRRWQLQTGVWSILTTTSEGNLSHSILTINHWKN